MQVHITGLHFCVVKQLTCSKKTKKNRNFFEISDLYMKALIYTRSKNIEGILSKGESAQETMRKNMSNGVLFCWLVCTVYVYCISIEAKDKIPIFVVLELFFSCALYT